MLHVYRQVSAIDEFEQWIVTRRRENAQHFPFNNLIELKKSRFRGFRRACFRLFGLPVPLDGYETKQLEMLVASLKIDIFHAYLGTEAARLLAFFKRTRCAKVVSFHGNDLSDSLSQTDFCGLLAHTDLFLVRSQSLANALIERGCPPERIRLNRTGIPIPEITRAIEFPDSRIRLLQACRFIEKKGLDVTLEALSLLKNQGYTVDLDLAGAGPEEAKLRNLANDLGIAKQVHFLGFLTNADLLARLPDYHLFVHPSRTTDSGDREGIPNSLLEAMAVGLPVISTRHSGIPEVISDGDNGYLIPAADPAMLAKAIVHLLEQGAEDFRRVSNNARKTVIDQYSTAANRQSLQASYKEAIALAKIRQY